MAGKRTKKHRVPNGPGAREWRRGLSILAAAIMFGLGALWLALGAKWGQEPRVEVASVPPAVTRAKPAGPSVPEPSARDAIEERPAAWRVHAVPAGLTSGRPMIAIVIDDVGVDKRRSALALALPAPLTMAFLPYARDLPRLTAAARARGHELLVHVPMEPMAGEKDAGPEPLVEGLPAKELRRRLDWMLDRFGGFVGINNHMGSRMTRDPSAMRIVLEAVHARGLLFLDSRTTAETVGPRIARELGMPVVERDVFLDNDQAADQVRAKLLETERVAARKGHAIAIGHPHDGTLEALAAWLPEARARGFVLVPVSAIVIEREKLAKANGRAGAVE